MSVRGNLIYVGGNFTAVGGRARPNLAVFEMMPVVAESSEPSGPSVGSVVPNPSRNRTSLRVATNRTERVRVDVYNMLGQRILVALDQPLAAGEAHSVTIETSHLAAGTYVVRVTGETFAETRRLTVVR